MLGSKINEEDTASESKKRCVDDVRENYQLLSEDQQQISNNNVKHIFLADVQIFNQHGEEIELNGSNSDCW